MIAVGDGGSLKLSNIMVVGFNTQPQSALFDHDQWRIAESSQWIDARGISPSNDSYCTGSMPTLHRAPHCDAFFDTFERRNRLESVVVSMAKGRVHKSAIVLDSVSDSNPNAGDVFTAQDVPAISQVAMARSACPDNLKTCKNLRSWISWKLLTGVDGSALLQHLP